MGEEPDKTNNRHLLLFLQIKSAEYKSFLEVRVSETWTINYASFYEFFSVLRNIVAHDGMMLSKNTLNTVKSISAQLFDYYFNPPDPQADMQLLDPKAALFLNFLDHANHFAGNTVKFIAGQPDFRFIGLQEA